MVIQRGDRCEGAHAAGKQYLGFVDVADPGEDALIQQHVGDGAVGALTDTPGGFVRVEVL
jgi:hypothetical protein